jgi:hypothetical protein
MSLAIILSQPLSRRLFLASAAASLVEPGAAAFSRRAGAFGSGVYLSPEARVSISSRGR